MSEATDRIQRGHPPGYFALGDALRGIACLVVALRLADKGLLDVLESLSPRAPER